MIEKELVQKIEIITPDIARKLLQNNKKNRPIVRNNLDLLCNELLNGNFKLNGETIKISNLGNVLDGQHRLIAVVRTGVPIETMIVYGLNEEVFATI